MFDDGLKTSARLNIDSLYHFRFNLTKTMAEVEMELTETQTREAARRHVVNPVGPLTGIPMDLLEIVMLLLLGLVVLATLITGCAAFWQWFGFYYMVSLANSRA